MPQNQWEYCQLYVNGQKEHLKAMGLGGTKGIGYDCGITYYNTSGAAMYQQLSDLNTPDLI